MSLSEPRQLGARKYSKVEEIYFGKKSAGQRKANNKKKRKEKRKENKSGQTATFHFVAIKQHLHFISFD